jgi:hypothetical protein
MCLGIFCRAVFVFGQGAQRLVGVETDTISGMRFQNYMLIFVFSVLKN